MNKNTIGTGQTKLCHHHPPPPTTFQNISTTTHHQPKYIHHHSRPPTDRQNFNKKPIYKNLQPLSDGNVRNLNSRPAVTKKLFFTWPSPLFILHAPEMVLKSCSVNEPLYYAKLVLKKDKCLSVENVLVLKFDKAMLKK